MLPQKATADDFNKIASYLVKYPDFVSINDMAASIKKAADARKIEAASYLGLIEKQGNTVRLTEMGRKFARGNKEGKQLIICSLIKKIDLYRNTVDWIYHQKSEIANKTDIASFWTQNYAAATGAAKGDALSDGAVFFIRVAEMAGLGKFVPAGRGRESHLKIDRGKLETFYGTDTLEIEGGPSPKEQVSAPLSIESRVPELPHYPSINVNIQIHISADAKTTQIKDIFKYMAEYVYKYKDE